MKAQLPSADSVPSVLMNALGSIIMADYSTIKTREIDRSKLDSNLQRISKFVETWNSYDSLRKIGEPSSENYIENINCLNYVIYEDLHHMFAKDDPDFIDLGSAMLGDVLVRLLKFEWCEIQISQSYTVGLKNHYNGLLVPIREMIVHRLSGLPQYGGFEYLYFDIFFSALFWQKGYHPLIECNDLPNKNDPSFIDIYGYEVPEDIKRIALNLENQDEEHWVRRLGFKGYVLPNNKQWDELRGQLDIISAEYAQYYGSDWVTRIEQDTD